MSDDNKKMAQEYVQTTLSNIFVWAMEKVRYVRFRLPVPNKDNTGFPEKVEAVLSESEMDQIFVFLKRGVNRVSIQKGAGPVFQGIHDQPDPEAEFDRQLFQMQADLLDKTMSEDNLKEKVAMIRALSDLIQTKKRVSIRKLDLKLAIAMAKHLDPTVTEERVIEILKFEQERLK